MRKIGDPGKTELGNFK